MEGFLKDGSLSCLFSFLSFCLFLSFCFLSYPLSCFKWSCRFTTYDQWNRLQIESGLNAAWCAEERRDLLLLNSESPVMDLLLSNLKSPVTDSIIDIADSPDWQSDITWCFSYYFWQVQRDSPTMCFRCVW